MTCRDFCPIDGFLLPYLSPAEKPLIRTTKHTDRMFIPGFRRITSTFCLLLILVPAVVAQRVPDGFMIQTISDELGRDPTAFALLPDGRVLVLSHQDNGLMLLVDGAVRENALLTFPDLKTSSEQGLLGIAVDPEFPDSNYIYVFHSVKDSTNRITRFTLEGELHNPASTELETAWTSAHDVLVLEDSVAFHNGGTVRFGPDGMLYVSHGDDYKLYELQDLTSPNGKILRIRRDGTAPDDNPTFPDAPVDLRKDVFAFGLRNPFRFAIDSETGALFIGDVGTNRYEELNVAHGGENFGYPHHEGPVVLEWTDHPWFDPDRHPVIGPEVTPPIYSYKYGAQAQSAIAVAAYRQRAYPHDASFPTEYDGAYFFADFFGKELKVLQPGAEGYLPSTFGTGFQRIVDGAVAADGSLYVLEYGVPGGREGVLSKISYTGSVAAEQPMQDGRLVLEQNFPNPFAEQTEIRFRTARAGDIVVRVYDLLGREVAVLSEGHRAAGRHALIFRAERLPAGVYLCRVESGDAVASSSMVLLR